ncbi:MAG: ABC transporter permease subunit [Clostridia bacterium]|nr:ABC transporter permease subunit [Clostridia bacterium]
MKKFFSLVKNENIKTVKQTSFKVLLIIFACIITVVPLASKGISVLGNIGSDNDYDYYLDWAEGEEKAGNAIGAEYYRSIDDSYAFFAENGIGFDSIQFSVFRYDHQDLTVAEKCTELIVSGKYSIEEMRVGYFDSEYKSAFYRYVMPDGYDYQSERNEEFYIDYDTEITDKEYDDIWSAENIAKAAPILKEKLSGIRKNILEFDLKAYYLGQYEEADSKYQSAVATLDAAKAAAALKPDDLSLAYSVKQAELYEEGMRENRSGIKSLFDNVYDYGSWQYITINDAICEAGMQYERFCTMPRDLYVEKYGEAYAELNYEKYKSSTDNALLACRETVKLGFYSLENNIPMPGAIPEGSVKTRFTDQLGTVVSISSLILIVLAGSTLSSEYSSGSIRLLLIRPRRRSRILASKIVSMALIWFAAIAAAAVIDILLDLILFGVKDAFMPDLGVTVSGKIVETPALFGILKALLEDMLASSVVISMALLLSTLVRRAALSIALPIIIQFIAGIVQTLVISVVTYFPKLHWLVYTPLPYSDLSKFRFINSAENFLGSGNGGLVDMLFGGTAVGDFLPWLGVIYLIAFTAAFIALSFVSFTKQQIKN